MFASLTLAAAHHYHGIMPPRPSPAPTWSPRSRQSGAPPPPPPPGPLLAGTRQTWLELSNLDISVLWYSQYLEKMNMNIDVNI